MSTKATTNKKKPALGAALAASLESEARSIDDRFANVERIFGNTDAATEQQPRVSIGLKTPLRHNPSVEVQQPEPEKPIRERVVRDSFSFPPHDHQQIDSLLSEVLRHGIRSNKSEIVRASLRAFASLPVEERNKIIRSLEKPKQGRPT